MTGLLFSWTHVSHVPSGSVLSALRRRTAGDPLAEDPGLCFSLRQNEEQLQLLCNDRRSKFNFNPFGLRFGKRYIYRRAVTRARTNKFSPLSLFPRELEVPTWELVFSIGGSQGSIVFSWITPFFFTPNFTVKWLWNLQQFKSYERK